jgi:Tfp pilus assembly protein PilP
MKMKEIAAFLTIFFILLSFGACKKAQQPAQKPQAGQVKPVEVQPETKVAEEVRPVVPDEYKYDAKGRRDPFLSLVVPKQTALKKKGASPFESYDLDEIQLMAIAWDKNKYFALIKLPDKKTYTITEGMILGLEGGKVEKITQDRVVIREYIKDYKGEIKERDSILKLHKGEEE